MMEEAEQATREMLGEPAGATDRPVEPPRASAEPAIVDIEPQPPRSLDPVGRLLAESERRAAESQRFERRLNVVIVLVAVLMIAALWFGLRGG